MSEPPEPSAHDAHALAPRHIGLAMIIAGWIVAFGGAYLVFDRWIDHQLNPNPRAALAVQTGPEVVLKRNRAGHYVADGEINGEPVTFLFDTGATQVALPLELARRLDLPLGRAIVVQTANGAAHARQTRLASVRVGTIELDDVSAIASDGLDGGQALLGMSFLKRLEFTQRDGRLTLRAPDRTD